MFSELAAFQVESCKEDHLIVAAEMELIECARLQLPDRPIDLRPDEYRFMVPLSMAVILKGATIPFVWTGSGCINSCQLCLPRRQFGRFLKLKVAVLIEITRIVFSLTMFSCHKSISMKFDINRSLIIFMQQPIVQSFFDPDTDTVTHVVSDPVTLSAAIIDSVMDYDPKSGRTSHASAKKGH
jgi:hypothetical protein